MLRSQVTAQICISFCILSSIASAALLPAPRRGFEADHLKQEDIVGNSGRKLLQAVRSEKYLSLSTLASHKNGGDTIIIKGEQFFSQLSYRCVFTWDSTGYSSCSATPPVAAASTMMLNSSATIDPSDPDLRTLRCTAPAFMPNAAISNTGVTDFSIMAVDSAGTESVVQAAFTNMTKFYFLDDTIIDNSASPAEESVYVEGVNCAGLDLSFSATQAMAHLRMVLEYTPLQPVRGESFIDSAMPSRDEILRKTDPMPSLLFADASALDLPTGDGKYCIGDSAHTLQLPYEGAAAPQAKVSKSGAQLNILDNLQQPSSIVIDSTTECSLGAVCGRMRWNVSRGWEGYAYQMCIKAVPAGIPVWGLDMTKSYVGSRCVYVVVPKCAKCVAPAETLYSIATSYSTSWLDLWSVNPELTNTTRASPYPSIPPHATPTLAPNSTDTLPPTTTGLAACVTSLF